MTRLPKQPVTKTGRLLSASQGWKESHMSFQCSPTGFCPQHSVKELQGQVTAPDKYFSPFLAVGSRNALWSALEKLMTFPTSAPTHHVCLSSPEMPGLRCLREHAEFSRSGEHASPRCGQTSRTGRNMNLIFKLFRAGSTTRVNKNLKYFFNHPEMLLNPAIMCHSKQHRGEATNSKCPGDTLSLWDTSRGLGVLEPRTVSTVKCNLCCFCIYLYVQIQRIHCKNIYVNICIQCNQLSCLFP